MIKKDQFKMMMAFVLCFSGCSSLGLKQNPMPKVQLPAINEPVETTVKTLLSSPHGFNRLSWEDQARLKLAQENPKPYLEWVQSQTAQLKLDHLSPTQGQKLAGQIVFLGLLKSTEANTQLSQWYQGFDAFLIRKPNHVQSLVLKRTILLSLANQPEKDVIRSILERLDKLDYATLSAALEYLASSSKGDDGVTGKITEYFQNVNSPLYNSADLKQVLKALRSKR